MKAKSLDQIFVQLDYAYGLLNQQAIIHYNGIEERVAKPATVEDIDKCKEVLRKSLNDLHIAINA